MCFITAHILFKKYSLFLSLYFFSTPHPPASFLTQVQQKPPARIHQPQAYGCSNDPLCVVWYQFSLKGCYAHVLEWWSQEYTCVTSLTFTERFVFARVVEEHCLAHAVIITIVTYFPGLSMRLLIRTVIINAWAKRFSSATLAFGSHVQRPFKHNSYTWKHKRCCTSLFVTIMLQNVRWLFKTHSTKVSCTNITYLLSTE